MNLPPLICKKAQRLSNLTRTASAVNRTAGLSGYVLYHCLAECSKRFALILLERRNTVVKLTPGIQSVCWIILREELSQRDSTSVTNRIYRRNRRLIVPFEDITDRCLRQLGFLRQSVNLR